MSNFLLTILSRGGLYVSEYQLRLQAIRRYLANERPVDIYTSLNRSRKWFYKWLNRYLEFGEDGLKDQSRRPKNSPNKTNPGIEQLIINIRKKLVARDTKDTFYSPIGADSILWELHKLGIDEDKIPSIPTINRIIKRNGLINTSPKPSYKHTIPYPAPLVEQPNDLHQFDPIGPRFINGTNGVERFFSLNLIDCFSKMIATRQYENARNLTIVDFLTKAVWNRLGIPRIFQVDNMLSIKGSNMHPRSPGIVIRLCLLLGIEVQFIPIREPQRNGTIESFNNLFDKSFFRIQDFKNLDHLKQEALFFEEFYCHNRPHSSLKINIHGSKIPYEVHMKHKPRLLSSNFSLDDFKVKGKIRIPLTVGKISFIRWVNKDCYIDIFSERFYVPKNLKYSYVKATILTKENVLQIIHDNRVVQEIPYYLIE